MIGHSPSDTSAKIVGLDRLMALRREARHQARAVVVCHGCFDIVHPGHIRHLQQAKALGDILVVSITGDAGVGKGTGRPLIPQELRAENLAALGFVDLVYIHSDPTAETLLDALQPDVYVKGREYETNKDPRFAAERDAVERHGGRVVFSSGDVVFSSTALISAIEQSIDPFHTRLEQLKADPELRASKITELIGRFTGQRVVVVGEVILDTYVLCDRPDIAGESPVMTLRPLERRQYIGGAAVLARHAAAMGAQPVLVTALPETDEGQAVRRQLLAEGVEVRSVAAERHLQEKQRFLVGTQKVMKLDLVEPTVLDAHQQNEFTALATEAAREGGGANVGIIADFGLGLTSARTLDRLCSSIRPHVNVMVGDVSGRRSSLRSLRRMDLLCPSEAELREAYRSFDDGLPLVVWKLLQDTACGSAIVTMGAEGLVAFSRRQGVPEPSQTPRFETRLDAEHVPALCAYAVDALGCGDALLTTAALTLSVGGSLLAAGFLGSAAAATEAQRIGNIPVSGTDLRRAALRLHDAHLAFAPAEVLSARVGPAPVIEAKLKAS